MDIHQSVAVRPIEIAMSEQRMQQNPFESFVLRRKRENASNATTNSTEQKLPPWY